MSIVAASLIVTDMVLSAMQLLTVFNDITRDMQAEGRTELTGDEWARITDARKATVKIALETP